MRYSSIFLIFICFFQSCSKTPQPINYGQDMCHFCQMTIVSKTHAAQMVTDKGKQYKFDAIECILNFLDDEQELIKESQFLISDYTSPGSMIDAKSSSFVISKQISSPMGANLTGFKSLEAAKKTIKDSSAAYYDWNGIFKKIN